MAMSEDGFVAVLAPDGTVDEAATARQRRINKLSDEFTAANPPPWQTGAACEDVECECAECHRLARQWHDARWGHIDAGMVC